MHTKKMEEQFARIDDLQSLQLHDYLTSFLSNWNFWVTHNVPIKMFVTEIASQVKTKFDVEFKIPETFKSLKDVTQVQFQPRRAVLSVSKALHPGPVIFFSCEFSLPPNWTIDVWLQYIQTIGFDHIIVSYAGNHTKKESESSNIELLKGTTLNDRSLCFVKHVYCGIDREAEPNWVRAVTFT